jgi:Leucine-rich repeat (LRR) protein
MLNLGLARRLSRLIVSNNKIATLRVPSPTARTSRLTRVHHLELSNNLIQSWSEVDALNELPALESLSIAGNPLLGEEVDDRGGTNRLHLIGRIGRIMKLEGTPVSCGLYRHD